MFETFENCKAQYNLKNLSFNSERNVSFKEQSEDLYFYYTHNPTGDGLWTLIPFAAVNKSCLSIIFI